MRRLTLPALLLALFAPAALEAQPRFLVGVGLTSPSGGLGDIADAGYHGQVGLFVQLPATPLGLRGDGFVHKLPAADPTLEDTQVLGATASLVYHFPGLRLVPYVLAGIGSYQVEEGAVGGTVETTSTGYHGGFGINVGTGGLGAFAEIRYVHIDGSTKLIPLTVGLRL